MGYLNETLLTAAVTTTRLQCLCAATLEMRSIQANNSPPNKLPNVFVSFGKTTFVVIDKVSFAVFAFITFFFTKLRFQTPFTENILLFLKQFDSFFEEYRINVH